MTKLYSSRAWLANSKVGCNF